MRKIETPIDKRSVNNTTGSMPIHVHFMKLVALDSVNIVAVMGKASLGIGPV